MAEFVGFQPSDFDSLAGSSWRNRDSLGGLLAARLSSELGRDYESWGARRRLELHIAQRESYDADRPGPFAKLFVYTHNLHTGADELAYGLYVESPPAGQDAARRYVHWLRFRDRLRERPAMQSTLLAAMINHGLVLGDYYRAEEDGGAVGGKFVMRDAQLLRWLPVGENWVALEPGQLFHHLGSLPSREMRTEWLNVHLFRRMSAPTALELGPGVVEPILTVLRALAPLYEMIIAER